MVNTDIRSQIQQHSQNQETKSSGWRLDKTNSSTVSLYETTEMNASNSVKIPLRVSAILNIENNDR